MLNLRAPNSFLSRRRVLVYYSVLHSLLYVVHTQGAPGYPPEYDPKPPGMIPGCGLTKHTKHTQPSGCFLARPQSSRIAQRGPRVLCIYLANQAQLSFAGMDFDGFRFYFLHVTSENDVQVCDATNCTCCACLPLYLPSAQCRRGE